MGIIRNILEHTIYKTHGVAGVSYNSFMGKCRHWKKKLSGEDYTNMVIKLAQTPTAKNDYIRDKHGRQCTRCLVYNLWDKMSTTTIGICKECYKNNVPTKRLYHK